MVDLIKTGLGLGKTMKNVARVREIVTVLSRNGFDEFLVKTGIIEKIPGFVLPKSQTRISEALDEYDADSLSASVGYRLRRSFEDLGPGFIKLGQLLSTREDIFPQSFIAEMKKLQDQVKGIPFDEAKNAIENSLGKKCEDVFASIDESPIGNASIGVAYRAKLKSGEDVVIKVRRPNVRKTIKTDFAIMRFVIAQIEKASAEIRHLAISRIIQDFSTHLETELDYRVEALNCERLKANIAKIDAENVFYLPHVYRGISTEDVLVMEYLDGVPFSDAARVNEVKGEIQDKLDRGIRVFVHNLLVDGFFHADLHGGNFFLLKNGRIGIIDFGLVGHLGKKSRANLVAILYSMVGFNFENLVYEFLEVAEYDSVPDVDALIADVKACLSPFMGLTVQQTNFSLLFRSVTATLASHQLYLPREWFIVFRALVTLDGVGKSLDMDFDIFSIIQEDIGNIVGQLVSKEEILEEAAWIGRDVIASARGLPRHVRWFMRELAKRNYAFEVRNTGYEPQFLAVAKSMRFLGHTVLAASFAGIGAHFLNDANIHSPAQIPNLTWLFWILAAAALATSPWKFPKN
jgi:ubiquinone biosynthesis protein